MADNFNATPGSGYVFSAEDIDDVLHTRVKIQSGVAGTANDVSVDNPLPTLDGGPSQDVTRTYTASADMTTAVAISPAPDSGLKIVGMDFIISTDTAMSFAIQEETSATVFAQVYLPANGTVQLTPRGYLKAEVADKRFYGKASVAGNVSVTVVSFSES